jgi:hypothetical protein
MKKIITTSMIIMLAIINLFAAGDDKKEKNRLDNDTTNYVEISGKIIDSQSSEPVVFATIFVNGSSVATVSNIDGEFVLKIPKDKTSANISFTHLGYENSILVASTLISGTPIIKLKSVTLPIDEVVVRSIDPVSLILTALEKVKNNYNNSAEMQTSFYREAVKQNRKYVSVSEAVLDIYKAPYKTTFDSDRLKIYKGRKSRDVKKMDTLLVKLQGGPKTSLMLDLVKHPGDILDKEVFKFYEFKLSGITTIDNRETYVINFDQKENVEYPLYTGNIYIDTETTAFAGMDFQISEKGLQYAPKYFVKKKPANLNIDVESGHYLIRYRKDNDNWYLNYVRSELDFDTKWKRKLFKSQFTIMLEMAVTDRDMSNIEKFSNKESAKSSDIFSDQVAFFEDNNFWGDYNTIKPDESIEVAIKKLNKKLKRH